MFICWTCIIPYLFRVFLVILSKCSLLIMWRYLITLSERAFYFILFSLNVFILFTYVWYNTGQANKHINIRVQINILVELVLTARFKYLSNTKCIALIELLNISNITVYVLA